MHIEDYFRHRELEIQANSAAADQLSFEAAPDGLSGRIFGNLGLTENVALRVHERISIKDGAFVVEKYVYNLMRDGVTIWAYDKDPTHDPVTHGHVGPNRVRSAAGRMTMDNVLRLAWEYADAWPEDAEVNDLR